MGSNKILSFASTAVEDMLVEVRRKHSLEWPNRDVGIGGIPPPTIIVADIVAAVGPRLKYPWY